MAHEFEIRDDGIVRLAPIGNQDKEDMEIFRKKMEPLLEAATEAEPVRLLVDSSRSGKTSAAGRKIYAEVNRDPRLGKTALVRARRYNRLLGSFILKASGRDNVRFFDSEEEAVALANDTPFALGAAVFGPGEALLGRLRAARVLLNEGPLYQDPHFVVGGVGDSGLAGARPKVEQLVWARRVHRAEGA